MSERALRNLIINLEKYVKEKIEKETKEESRAALVNIGILDEDGNITKEYEGLKISV